VVAAAVALAVVTVAAVPVVAAPAPAGCTWTVRPVDGRHCTLRIDASQGMGPVRGLLMRLFYGINFKRFIEEAERRATTVKASVTRPMH
jgi:hypothetical protein